ncbi:unnamed protein product, partial [Closterium sp. NIES-53]
LVAAVLDFASSHRLDCAAQLVTDASRPPSVGGEFAFGYDVLENMQFELAFLLAVVPHLCAMLLVSEGDPNAFDIPNPRTYTEAVLGPWATLWIAAMEAEMASWRSTGILEAPREWHDTLCTTLHSLGFAPSSADPSLFVRSGRRSLYILVYVDDLVFATADRVALASVKAKLQRRHTCTDLGDLCHYLGLQITRDRAARTITLSRSHLVHQILDRFGFRYSSP